MDLETYRVFQKRLLELLGKAVGIARELGFPALIKAAGDLERRVLSERFSVAVLGEIKRGKSTLINALLGEDVLPRAALVCTAALCLIRHADSPLAVMHGRDGSMSEVDPRSLKELVTRKNPDAQSVDHVEIGWPLPLLRDGVVIIDTPGVNDTDEVRRRLTEEFIPRADGVIFVLNGGQPLSDSEVRFLKNGVLKHHIKKCWFVVNGIDRIPDETQRKEAVEYCRRNLAEIHPDIRIWGVSAKSALEARRKFDTAAWIKSGVAELLDGLSTDLVESRRDALFDVPAARLESMLDDLEQGHARLSETRRRSERDTARVAAEQEQELISLESERDIILTRFTNAVESLIFETVNSDENKTAPASRGDRSRPPDPRQGTPRLPDAAAADHLALRSAVEAILETDSLDETKTADLRQLIRDQVMIEASSLFDRIGTAAQPIAIECSRDLSKRLARFDSRVTVNQPGAAASLVEFRKDFEVETISLGLETRQFVSGFGRLATIAFLMQGNILFAAAAFGASLAARMTGDMAREITANIEHAVAEEKKALRQEIIRRRSEISQSWKRDLTARFDQGLAVIHEARAAARTPENVVVDDGHFESILAHIRHVRAELDALKERPLK